MAEEAAAAEESVVDPFSLFPPQWRLPIEGLIFLGQLSDDVEFCGHTFVLHTLLPQDKLAIASAMQPYRNTLMEVDAYQAAHVGAALTAVDHDENFCPPVGPDINAFARARLNWVIKHLYPPVVEMLWTRLALLEATAAQGMRELDRLLQGSQPPSPPWLDSLTEPGSSLAETDSAILPFMPSSTDS